MNRFSTPQNARRGGVLRDVTTAGLGSYPNSTSSGCTALGGRAVFALYLAENKIEAEVVENMRSWPHSGFHVDQSVFLAAGNRAGLERVMHYMTRCPFSLSRLVKVTASGEVVYKAEKDACRAFPDPQGDGLTTGPKRNFQVLSPLDFLAEFTQHIPPKGAHLVRYYGWYSNKARGLRRKAAAAEAAASNLPSPVLGRGAEGGEGITRRASQTWAMLIKRVYEIDPLSVSMWRPHEGRRLH